MPGSGVRIAHYELGERLGAGGMGEVREARDLKLQRVVAIKSILPALIEDPEARARFLRETRAATQLNHPYVCQVFDVLEHEGRSYIVMERVEGESLAERLRRGALPRGEAVAIATEIAEALIEAHRHGIIHRDIKPSNLMLTRSGHIKVMDFGLARRMTPAEAGGDPATQWRTQSRPGAVAALGTPGYLSPEQALGRETDARGDLYALGVVLFEMIAGRAPHSPADAATYFYQLFNLDAPRLATLRAEVPPALDALVAALLARDPQARPDTAEHVRARLLEIGRGTQAAAPAHAVPKTRYARSGDVSIAYQVVGESGPDVVQVSGWVSHIEMAWQQPVVTRYLDRLASFSRLIMFDKRGTGLSDRVAESALPTLEQRMDDVRAVMDAVGSERAVVLGISEGGPMSALFAVTYPERTRGLVLYGTYAKRVWAPEYPWAPTPEERQGFFDWIERDWGGVVDLSEMAPSLANDESFRQFWSGYLRAGASPSAALALAHMNTEIDIRHVLPVIRVPTLVLHRTGDRDCQVGGGRYLAERIPGARYVEMPGDDHIPYAGDVDCLLGELERFVRGLPDTVDVDRVLATILVCRPGAAAPAAKLSEGARLQHRRIVSESLARFRGVEVAADPNGVTASFDGPARAIRCALAVRDAARREGLEVRCGLHTGECEVTATATRGLAVEIAGKIAAQAGADEVLTTGTVRDLVAGSGLTFEDRGPRTLAAIPGEWRCFIVRT